MPVEGSKPRRHKRRSKQVAWAKVFWVGSITVMCLPVEEYYAGAIPVRPAILARSSNVRNPLSHGGDRG